MDNQTRTELEALIQVPLDGVISALEALLARNGMGWSNLSAIGTVGGAASIPLITQRLSEHTKTPVVTTPRAFPISWASSASMRRSTGRSTTFLLSRRADR